MNVTQNSIFLSGHAYPDERVHEFAIKCINEENDETIEMFLCQLVQALKHQNYFNSALCDFLLGRALRNQRFGQKVRRDIEIKINLFIFYF